MILLLVRELRSERDKRPHDPRKRKQDHRDCGFHHRLIYDAPNFDTSGRGQPARGHSVEILGSAWTFSGTIMRKLLVASAARSRMRTASSDWSVAFSSSA